MTWSFESSCPKCKKGEELSSLEIDKKIAREYQRELERKREALEKLTIEQARAHYKTYGAPLVVSKHMRDLLVEEGYITEDEPSIVEDKPVN